MAKYNKVRKNATKKINALLAMATEISFQKYHYSLESDCWVYASKVSKDVAFVLQFIEAEYHSDLSIHFQSDENDQPFKMSIYAFGGSFDILLDPSKGEAVEPVQAEAVKPATVKTCKCCGTEKQADQFFHSKKQKDGLSVWCKACNAEAKQAKKDGIEFVPFTKREAEEIEAEAVNVEAVNVEAMIKESEETTDRVLSNLGLEVEAVAVEPEAVAEKPRATYADVKEALKAGYISPLNNDQKSTDIESIKVIMSEASIVNLRKGEIMNLETYKKLMAVQILCNKYPTEYNKTIVEVTTKAGIVHTFTHQHNTTDHDIAKAWNYQTTVEASTVDQNL